MAMRRRPKVKVEIRLPGQHRHRRRRRGVRLAHGARTFPDHLARLWDDARCRRRNDDGFIATVYPVAASRRQLWYLRPSGHAGEVLIVSADNGLALDATRPEDDGKPLLWEPHGAAWQRWTLEPCPDGAAFYVGSVAHRRVLVMSNDAEPRWQPWLEERQGKKPHEWLFAVPHGEGLT